MINLVLSLAIGLGIAVLIRLGFDFPWVAAIIPGAIAFIASFILLGRRIFVKLQAINSEVQRELQAMPPNQREQKIVGPTTELNRCAVVQQLAPLQGQRVVAKPQKARRCVVELAHRRV